MTENDESEVDEIDKFENPKLLEDKNDRTIRKTK